MSETQTAEIENTDNKNLKIATIDPETIQKLSDFVENDSSNKDLINQDNIELDQWIKHWKEYSDQNWGNQERIPLVDFLKKTNFVEKNISFEKKYIQMEWSESVRWSTEDEKQFVQAARQIGKGKFIEILQFSIISGYQIIYKNAVAGSGSDVSDDDAFGIFQGIENITKVPETVFIIHNHPDHYAEFSVPSENFEGNNGLATVGGLSRRDIKFADDVWENVFNKQPKVVMMAIGERGLTYTYIAGTSVYHD